MRSILFLSRSPAEQGLQRGPAHNLYVCVEGCDSLRNHLLLRDHMRAHPQDAKAYGDLKRELARKYREGAESGSIRMSHGNDALFTL